MDQAYAAANRSQQDLNVSFNKRSPFGVNVRGVVLSGMYNENKYENSTIKSIGYTLRVRDIADCLRGTEGHPAIVPVTDGGAPGFRFTRSDVIKKKDGSTKTKHFGPYAAAVRESHKGLDEEQRAEMEEKLVAQCDDSDGKFSFHVDTSVQPFTAAHEEYRKKIEVREGGVIYFDVTVKSKADMIGNCTLVQVMGLTLEGYGYTPKPPAPQVAEFRLKLKAADVMKMADNRNDFPYHHRSALFCPQWSQEVYNPVMANQPPNVTPQPVLIVSPVARPIPAVVLEKRFTALIVSENEYTRNGKTCLTDAKTFLKSDEEKRPVYPIVLKTTNFAFIPAGPEQEKQLAEIEQYYPNERTESEKGIVLNRHLVIKGILWTEDCRNSGIAGTAAWVDVNTFRPIDVTVELSKDKKKTMLGDNLDLTSYRNDWHILEYLEEQGTPISLAFAEELLGGKTDLVNGALGDEPNQEGKLVPVLNGVNSNPARNTTLLNASEYSGSIKDHIDPKNGWLARALIVPQRAFFAMMPEKKQTKITDGIAKLKGAKTPEEGDELIEALHKSFTQEDIIGFASKDNELNDLRCIVWFYKPLAPELKAKLDPNAIAESWFAAPSLKRAKPESDDNTGKEDEDEPAAKKPKGDGDDAMEVDFKE
jgi:hypothetical protein